MSRPKVPMRAAAAVSFAAALLAGCVSRGPEVTPGTYSDPTGEERIVVADDGVAFHVWVGEGEARRFLSRRYPGLVVQADGAIWPLGLPSQEAVHFMGPVRWRWTGTSIVRTIADTGERTEFERRGP